MTKRNGWAVMFTAVLCAAVAQAHEGHPHIMGTVVAVDPHHIVVQTTDGKNLSVLVDKDTKYRQGDKAAAAADLKVGDRVVAEVSGTGDSLTASDIRFAPTAAHQGIEGHEAHQQH